MDMYRLLLPLALCLAAAAPAAAARENMEFSLRLARHELRFDYPTNVDTRYTQLKVEVIERSYKYLHGGFRIGISDLSQSGNPPADGLSISGGTVGFVLRSDVPLGAGFGFHAQGSYDYHTVDGSTDDEDAEDQSVRLDWFEFDARAGLSLTLEPLILRTGPYYRHVDGDERDRGDVDRTLALEAEDPVGVFGDIVYVVDPTGWIALRIEHGSRSGATLSFTRLFD